MVRKRRTRLLAVGIVGVLLTACGPTTSSLAPGDRPTLDIQFSRPEASPGDRLDMFARGFTAGELVSIALRSSTGESRELGTGMASDEGDLGLGLEVGEPPTQGTASVLVVLRGRASGRVAQGSVRVLASLATGATGTSRAVSGLASSEYHWQLDVGSQDCSSCRLVHGQ